jgi:peptidoglycan/LPS O-acetylase OafA/YrhL
MGVLRFLLATCVIAAHARSTILGLPLMASGLAVRTFFMISGFYMTLILSSKYRADRKGGKWLFISNRFLRIYPSYLVVLGVSVLFLVAGSLRLHAPVDRVRYWADAWHGQHYGAMGLILLSQVSIFGLDVIPMFDFSAAHGYGWAGAWGGTGETAWRFTILPPAWSISVELMFYLLAPLICFARRWMQMALVAASMLGALAVWKWMPGTLADMLTYYFFPFQLGYLVLGVLSFHLLHPLFEAKRIHVGWSLAVLPPFAATILFSGWLPSWLVEGLSLGLGFFAVPLLFNLTRRIKVDRFIGDLSYPMYLSHIPCKWILLAGLGVTRREAAIVPCWELLLLTTMAGVMLLWLVDYPVDRWRQARVVKMHGAGA